MRIKVEGGDAVRRALTRLVTSMHEAGEEVAETWADEVLEKAKTAIPVRSGYLAKSIDKKITKGAKPDAHVGFWKKDAYYSQFVEFGTSSMSAQPFLYPSATPANKKVRAWLESAFKKRLP